MNLPVPAADTLGLQQDGSHVLIPLARNVNDKGGLFAGSIFAGATLAGYRLTEKHVAEHQLSGEIVAKGATITYLKRIESDGRAIPTPLTGLLRKPNNNYTISMRIDVMDATNTCCAQLTTEYILVTPRPTA